MCGVCGEIGLPGLLEVLALVPAIMGGTAESWREEELELRWSSKEEERLSDRAAVESLIPRYLCSAVAVRRMLASRDAESVLLNDFRSFFCSSKLMKSRKLSSSVGGMLPEEPAAGSLITSEPCRADEEADALPELSAFSSSPLLPPEEKRERRWEKLLL